MRKIVIALVLLVVGITVFAKPEMIRYIPEAGAYEVKCDGVKGYCYALRNDSEFKDYFQLQALLSLKYDKKYNVEYRSYTYMGTEGMSDDLILLTYSFGRVFIYGEDEHGAYLKEFMYFKEGDKGKFNPRFVGRNVCLWDKQ